MMKILVIVCCVSIQEKVRRSPNGFFRKGDERERVGGGGGQWGHDLENELAGRSTLNQRHRFADLPWSWRLTSTRTHSLPRTLVFRGFTSDQLGSSQFVFELVSRDHTNPPPPSLSLSLSLPFPFLTKPFGERRTFSCNDEDSLEIHSPAIEPIHSR